MSVMGTPSKRVAIIQRGMKDLQPFQGSHSKWKQSFNKTLDLGIMTGGFWGRSQRCNFHISCALGLIGFPTSILQFN
jgi:hypothetical protein